ncbi:MAG: hypothetical protein JNM58_00865 [Xanthomonadaceae bacterium]|nr:hypothetical protein [Xanthomonadaceae bacterium]
MYKTDAPGHDDNEFTDGNPLTGTPATVLDAAFMNEVMYELINVLLAAGITPTKGVRTQLLDAIISIAAGGGEAVTAAGVSVEDAGDYFAGTNVEDVLQELGAVIATGTYAASRIRRGVVALAGASHQTDAAHWEQVLEISHGSAATYTVRPDADANAPVGTSITVFQTGGGQVEVVQGSGVTVHKGASFNRKSMEQHASMVLVKVAANTWRLGGMLEAAA